MIGTERRERIEELARALDGELAAEDARREVRQLVSLVGHVRAEVAPVVMTADARDAVRDRVLAELLHPAPEPAPVRQRVARSARTAVATGVASVLVATSGVAVAAQEALPDDVLYGVKKATESVRLAMAGDLTESGRVELSLARERLEEVTLGNESGRVRTESLIRTLAEMDQRSLTGAEALVRVAERSGSPEHLAELIEFTELQAEGIVAIFDDLPVVVRPHAEDSISTLRRIRVELLAPLIEACDCADVIAASASDCLVCGLEDLADLLTSSPLPRPTAPPEGDGPSGDGAPGSTTGQGAQIDADTGDGDGGPLPGGTPGGDVRTGVPELPGPLETAGRTVERVTDTVDKIVGDTGRTVEKVVGDTGKAVDGLLDDPVGSVGGLVDDTLGTVGGVVDDTLGTVGRLLGGGRDG